MLIVTWGKAIFQALPLAFYYNSILEHVNKADWIRPHF